MPAQLSLFERIGLFRLNMGPGPMVDLLGVLSFRSVMAALRLGLFDAIGSGTKSIDELAAATGSDRGGLSLLAATLHDLGYLRLRRGSVRNTAMTRKWLLRDSASCISPLFDHFSDMASRWEYLDRSIREGRPPMMGWEWLDRDRTRWEIYHAGLKSTAVLISPYILKKIAVPPSATRILDLGGSHGQYCVEFCKRYPGLTGVIYDWPSAADTAKQTIASSGCAERISFQPGDFLKDDLPPEQDVILMFNIIRIFEPGVLGSVLMKVRDSLKRGGMIIIMDHIGRRSASRFMRLNALLILLEIFNSTEGRIYSAAEVSDLLRETGFSGPHGYNLSRSPGLGLMAATRP